MSPPALRNKPKVIEPTDSPNAVTSRGIEERITENVKLMLVAFENRVMERFSSMSAEITNLKADIARSNAKLSAVTKRCDSLELDVIDLRARLNVHDNQAVAADLIIMNVPNEHNPSLVVEKLLLALDVDRSKLRKVFRTHLANVNKSESVPIIVKLCAPEDRVILFKSLAEFRKKRNKQLTMCDLGLVGDTNIYVHECLSPLNREILRSALHFKKTNLLNAAYSLRGHVYVRVKTDGKAIKTTSIAELNAVVGGA